MSKIIPEHLLRDVYVYIRQSTSDQLAHNPESRRRQYALKGRAETLGWQNVVSSTTILVAPAEALHGRV